MPTYPTNNDEDGSASIGSFSFRRSFLRKKKKGDDGATTPPSSSVAEGQQLHQLQKINETSPQDVPAQQNPPISVATASDADSAFLSALRGSGGVDTQHSIDEVDATTKPNITAAKGSSRTSSIKTSTVGNVDADNAFLAALRGGGDSSVPASSEGGFGPASSKGIGKAKVQPPVVTDRARAQVAAVKQPANASGNDADNAFLAALRGGADAAVVGISSTDEHRAVTASKGSGTAKVQPPPVTNRARAQVAAANQPSATTASGNDADNAFLAALRGGGAPTTGEDSSGTGTTAEAVGGNGATPHHQQQQQNTPAQSDADNAFLSALRGQPPPTHTRGTTRGSSMGDSAISDLSSSGLNINSYFASASGHKSFTNTAYPSAISNATAAAARAIATTSSATKRGDDIAHANAAFLGALHASTDPPDDAPEDQQYQMPARPDGTLVFNSKQKIRQKRQQTGSSQETKSSASQSDGDSAFLLAVRGSSQASATPSFGGSEFQDSGTLVLNSPKKAVPQSNANFMMAIHASAEDAHGHSKGHSITTGEVKDEANIEAEEDEDDDMEGLKVPSHPYMEKVMLPRPLFFGNVLPPSIVAEAERAALEYVKDADLDSPVRKVEPMKSETVSMKTAGAAASTTADPLKDSEHTSLVSRSTISTLPSFGGNAKKFESPILPCCRNLAGAIEAFGFGVNPFSTETREDEIIMAEPKAPHPYVSTYAPVWGDIARADRAKSRRKREKLSGDAVLAIPTDAEILEATAESVEQPLDPLSQTKEADPSIQPATEQATPVIVESTPYASSTQADESSKESDGNSFSKDQFSMFARAGSGGNTFVGSKSTEIIGSGTFISKPTSSKCFSAPPQMDSNTFVQAVKSGDTGDDDDSIDAAEERKAVGLNDNISAAAAMLAGEGVNDDDGDENVQGGIGTSMYLAAGGGAKAATKFGRPYTNFELTNGCVPQFGCDDPSLPHESDLGVFETRDEEKRTSERRREKNIIEDLAVPGIMPPVACPTQCTDVDDSQSWNTRAAATDGGSRSNNNNTVLISLDGNASSNNEKFVRKSPVYEANRVGWWNLPEGFDASSAADNNNAKRVSKKCRRPCPDVEVFPALDDPIPLDVITNLWPSPRLLKENNLSLTRLHPATSTARFLPHLSDRAPSIRHLQIDTTAVGFPKLGGEIEPMFCKLAIYHFDMNSELSSDKDSESFSTGMSSFTPAPNMERCGRVTESLNFDVVQDPSVIENCKRALWPYATEAEIDVLPGAVGMSENVENAGLEGTPCGIFPLPGNLSISNLYAVITVHKVLSESADLQPYFKPSRREKATTKQEEIDLTKLRENAAKASNHCGQFLTPFAFGVVPLMHIIGNESPKVPVSRAVQIPLFKFTPGRGAQSILDHILVMLYPRAEPKVGKAASVTRGHALLVMRYFGYLGLHSIIEKKSSLARDRLVDFTGELQVRREDKKDAATKSMNEKCPDLGDPYIIPPWRQHFVVEPASFGGRNSALKSNNVIVQATLTNKSGGGVTGAVIEDRAAGTYAQEVATLPLENSTAESGSSRKNRSSSKKYDGMLLHTSFCNEVVVQPKMLKKCPKKNVVVKVELRELQWSESLNVDVAVPLKPSIHNTRRGPWLVQDAFTSCALATAEPQWLDEFKIKLPLILGEPGHEKIGLFFSVYHVNVKKKKSSRLQAMSRRASNGVDVDLDDAIEHIGSGFLPLTLEDSPYCLIANGDHDVPITYRTIPLADTADEMAFSVHFSGRHRKSSSFGGNIVRHIRSWSNNSDDDVKMTMSNETISEDDASAYFSPPSPAESNKYPIGTLAIGRLQGRKTSDHGCIGDTAEESDDGERSLKSDTGAPRLGSKALEGSTEGPKGLRPVLSSGNLQFLDSSSQTSDKELSENELVLKVSVCFVNDISMMSAFSHILFTADAHVIQRSTL